jgi:microcystin-dependent protein
MSKLKVDIIYQNSVTGGVQLPNGIKVGSSKVEVNQIISKGFVGGVDLGIGYAYPATSNSMTSKRYVDDAINSLLTGAGLSGVSKQYVDTGLSASYTDSTNYTVTNMMRKNASNHNTDGIQFEAGPYIITTSFNPSLEISAAAPVLRLTETDTANSNGTIHLDSGILKMAYGSSVSSNNNSIAINASGHMGIGESPAANSLVALTLNNRVASGSAPALRVMGSGDVVINTGGSIFFDNLYNYSTGSYLDARTAGVQKFKNGIADRMVISTTNVNIPLSTLSTIGVTGVGALTILGGVGVGENLNVGGVISGAGTIPVGGVIMWSGSVASVPAGWALCNGQTVNSLTTPDLRDKFIIGASGDNAGIPNTTITSASTQKGGSKDAVLVSHGHTASDNGNFANHRHLYFMDDNTVSAEASYDQIRVKTVNNGGGQGGGSLIANLSSKPKDSLNTFVSSLGITVGLSGESGTNKNLPPYYALAFIMRIR